MDQQYEEIKTKFGTLTIRRYVDRDIAVHSNYLYESPRDFLESIGFDPNKFPPKADWISRTQVRLAAAHAENSKPNIIVAELNQIAVAMVFLDLRLGISETPKLHFHIFNPELRGQGIGPIVLGAGIRHYSMIYGYKRFLIEPKSTNLRMNKLMLKMGFKYLKNYILKAGPFTGDMEISQYEILPELLNPN